MTAVNMLTNLAVLVGIVGLVVAADKAKGWSTRRWSTRRWSAKT